MKFYFILQYKRLYRHLDEFGVIPWLVFCIVAALFYQLSNKFLAFDDTAEYVYTALGIGLSLLLGKLQRNDFLKNCFERVTYLKLRLLENNLSALPFSGMLLFNTYFTEAIVLHIFVSLTSQFNTIRMNSVTIPTPFGKYPFEFTAGFRKTYWMILLLYFFSYIAVSVENYNLGLVAIIVFFVVCLSYYSKPEPLFYVWIHQQTPHQFLQQKLKTAFLYSILIVLPMVTALLWKFFKTYWDITLLTVFVGYALLTITIFGKYSNYPSQIPIQLIIALLGCVLFPPLIIIVIPILYRQAIKNLTPLLPCSS